MVREIGTTKNDRLHGGQGNSADTLSGGDGHDYLYGYGGDDWLYGDNGRDTLVGATGTDLLFGGEGNDTFYGGNGGDTLVGGIGNDTLYGDAGKDTLSGGAGKDTLWGGAGKDTLWGGAGNDTFAFTLASSTSSALDIIKDFDPNSKEKDKIYIQTAIPNDDDFKLTKQKNGLYLLSIGSLAVVITSLVELTELTVDFKGGSKKILVTTED